MAVPARRAFLIYPKFLSADGSRPTIGGIQTYIQALAQLFVERGVPTTILQIGDSPFETTHEGLRVAGITGPRSQRSSVIAQFLWKEALRRGNESRDFFVFCTHGIAVRTSAPRAISIQHGVSWDIPLNMLPVKGILRRLSIHSVTAAFTRKAYQAFSTLRAFNFVKTQVCVDYNFPNWMRASSGLKPLTKIHVIPNCVFPQHADSAVDQAHFMPPSEPPTRIIFARRFEQYRGTRLMADVVDGLLDSGHNFSITFAGEGGDLPYLQARFKNQSKVRFVSYDPRNSVQFHRQFHIAVAPSLASEGTTLSVLEAMAAGCAIVATPVGGITNLIIDDWNGVLVAADAAEIASAIVALTTDQSRRAMLSQRARAMTDHGPFSYDKWRSRWLNIIEKLDTES